MTRTHQQVSGSIIDRPLRIAQVLKVCPSKLERTAAVARRLLGLPTPLLALVACGGGDSEVPPPPSVSVSDTGEVTVERASVFLAAAEEGVAVTLFQLNAASAIGDVADVPLEVVEAVIVDLLSAVSVEQGHFVVAVLGDFALGGFGAGVRINGALWLQAGFDDTAPSETATLIVALDGHDLIIDMPSDDYSITLAHGSQIDLAGGRIIVSDGTLDLVAVELVDVTDIVINSMLKISVQQLADLGGTVSSGGSGTLNIVLSDMSDAELLRQILADKTTPSGLTLALEAKTPEVATYLDEVLLPDIAATLPFKEAGAVAGENDAPSSIEVTLFELPENVRDLVVATFTVIDVDPGDTHVITLSDDRFTVVGNEIILADGVSLDFEAERDGVITLTITATDLGGLSVDQLVQLQILDVNEAPSDLNVTTFPILENQMSQLVAEVLVIDPDAGDTHDITLSDDRFAVQGNQIFLAAGIALDFETENVVTLTITATDAGGLSISRTVTLEVIDVNDAPTAIVATTYAVPENATGVLVADILVEDPDADDSHVISVSDPRFIVIGNQLFLAEGESLDFEIEQTVSLTITATDIGGLSISKDVTLEVIDVNEAPTAIIVDAVGIPENMEGVVVATLAILDPDKGDTHIITLSDERFVVIGNEIILADGVTLDFETESVINLTITATDTGGLSLSRTVTLEVIDVNEAPTALSLANTVTSAFENQVLPTRLLVADLIVADDALGTNSFSLSGPNAGYFEVVSGRLYLKAGVLPEFDLNPNLDVIITVFDATLPGSAPVSTQMTVNLRETNASLAAASTNAVGFKDVDGSNSYTAGDTITLRFNSTINVASFTTSDFTVSNGSLGNTTLTALNAVNGRASEFTLTLGSTSALSSQSGLSVKQYAITDIDGLPNANVISFALPPITTGFDIALNYSGDSTYLSIFEAAVAVWERVIIGDLPNVGAIDDLLIDVSVEYIDGRGGILGYASVTHLRSSSDGGLPYKGYMVFDETDFASMPRSEAIDVAIHEIAHVLGFGILWSSFNLASGAIYTGANAVREFFTAGGQTDYIPLETEGGPGTAYYHWDEEIFGREIMTGYLNSGENYLSAITIGAMEDLGYVVDYSVADPYTLAASVLV